MYDERIVYKNGSYMYECYFIICEILRKGGGINFRGIVKIVCVWWICVNNDVKYGCKILKIKLDK